MIKKIKKKVIMKNGHHIMLMKMDVLKVVKLLWLEKNQRENVSTKIIIVCIMSKIIVNAQKMIIIVILDTKEINTTNAD